MSLNQYQKAKEVLLSLCDLVPKEAPIHLLLGKIWQYENNNEQALKEWNIAMELDPKNVISTKALIEKLEMDGEDRKEESGMMQ